MQKNDMSVLSVLSVWRFIDQSTRQIEQRNKGNWQNWQNWLFKFLLFINLFYRTSLYRALSKLMARGELSFRIYSRSAWSPRPPSLFLATRARLTFRFSKPKVNWLLHISESCAESKTNYTLYNILYLIINLCRAFEIESYALSQTKHICTFGQRIVIDRSGMIVPCGPTRQ